MFNYLPSRLLWLKAILARRSGNYHPSTLKLAQLAYHQSPKPLYLLTYLKLRRDFGFKPNKHLVKRLCTRFSDIKSPSQRRSALQLITEYYLQSHDKQCLELLTQCKHELASINTPASDFFISHYLNLNEPSKKVENNKGNKADKQRLAHWYEQQTQWRKEYLALIQTHKQQGICIVGNGGILKGSALGDTIDKHDCVIRFNHFEAVNDRQDIGQQCDIWVTTAGFVGQAPSNMDWIIVSGPEVLFTNQQWRYVLQACHAETKVVFVPLSVWQKAVKQLSAPPSAGFLLLTWLNDYFTHQQLGWDNVSLAGFNALLEDNKTPKQQASSAVDYHITSAKAKASTRHDWHKEAVLLQQWLDKGLQSLHHDKNKADNND